MLTPGCGANALGHRGAGGWLGFADPDLEPGCRYVRVRMKLGVQGDERVGAPADAVYACI